MTWSCTALLSEKEGKHGSANGGKLALQELIEDWSCKGLTWPPSFVLSKRRGERSFCCKPREES